MRAIRWLILPAVLLSVDPALAQFAPDRFETNDAFGTATDLGTVGSRTETNLSIHAPDETDYFRITAASSGSIEVHLLFDHSAAGDLDLRLFHADERPIAASFSSDDDEHLTNAVVRGSNYIVWVYGYELTRTNLYDLSISLVIPPGDRFEPNNTFTNAHDLGLSGHPAESGLSIHVPEDEDVCLFTPAWSGTATVGVSFAHSAGDLDLKLYDGSTQEVASSTTRTDNELVTHPVTQGSNYFVSVLGYAGATNGYALNIDCPNLVADRFEPNDEVDQPAEWGTLVARVETNLTIHTAGNLDYFRFRPASDGTVVVELRHMRAMGDLFMTLYDNDGHGLAGTSGTGDVESVSFPVVESSNYIVRVVGSAASTNQYTLAIHAPSFPGDRFETNNTIGSATPLGSLGAILFTNLSVHSASDRDFFRFTPSGNGTLTATVTSVTSNEVVFLSLLDAGGNPLAGKSATNTGCSIVTGVWGSTTYSLAVSNQWPGATGFYHLAATVTPFAGDRFEPNDGYALASSLGVVRDRVEAGLSIHASGNYDYFKVRPAYRGLMRITMTAPIAVGDLDLYFRDQQTNLIALSSQGTADVERIEYMVHPASNYFIVVDDEWSGDTNSYSLTIDGPGPELIDWRPVPGADVFAVRWTSATDTTYQVSMSTNLVLTRFDSVVTGGVFAAAYEQTVTVTVDAVESPRFFRVRED